MRFECLLTKSDLFSSGYICSQRVPGKNSPHLLKSLPLTQFIGFHSRKLCHCQYLHKKIYPWQVFRR